MKKSSSFLPKLTKKGLLVSYEHKGYFYSINDKKELIAAKKIKKFIIMKNILVTGGLGLLGKPLVSFLRKKKYNIFVLDRSKNKKRNSLIKGRNINFIYGNYQNKNFLKKIIKNKKINVIFHTGAVTQVLEGLKYPFKTYKNNIMGTINILECIRQINPSILLIYSSSDKAYGEIKKRNYLENDNLNSIYPYDLSKTCSDLICQSY